MKTRSLEPLQLGTLPRCLNDLTETIIRIGSVGHEFLQPWLARELWRAAPWWPAWEVVRSPLLVAAELAFVADQETFSRIPLFRERGREDSTHRTD